MTAVANITRYTNTEEYELIIVDCCPKWALRDDLHVFTVKKFMTLEQDPGYFASMNIGAKEAKGKYLCFIENDVFVQENWLPDLRRYLEGNMADAILPNQMPMTRAEQLQLYEYDYEEAIGKARREQGLVLIKREAFDKIGGWDIKMPVGYGWRRFYNQLTDNNISLIDTAKVTVTHIAGATY